MNVDFTSEEQPIARQANESSTIHRPYDKARAQAAAARILKLREGHILPEGVTIRSMIDEGRD